MGWRACGRMVGVVGVVGLLVIGSVPGAGGAVAGAGALDRAPAALAWKTSSEHATGAPIDLPGAPTGVGLVGGRDALGRPVLWRWPVAAGTPTSLGVADHVFFYLGTTGDATRPPLLVASSTEALIGSDLTGDGDTADLALVTSRDGGPLTPLVAGMQPPNQGSGIDCLSRLTADLGVVCQSEAALGRDLNADGDLADLRIVLLHGDGTVTYTGSMLDVNAYQGVFYGKTVLADGSVSLGPLRVHTDGSITTNPVAAGQVVSLVGTSEVVREQYMSTNHTFVVPVGGSAVQLPGTPVLYPVGTATWVQGTELCRLTPSGAQACLGIQAQPWSGGSGVTPLGDDAALVLGAPLGAAPGTWVQFVVRAGGAAVAIGTLPDRIMPLADHSALVFTTAALVPAVPHLVHVTATGAPVPLTPDVRAVGALALDDGRALIQLVEAPGVDLNGDGDVLDVVTVVFAHDGLVSTGVLADLALNFGSHPTAVSLRPDGPILVGVDEEPGHDLNADGDTDDMVAAVVDGGTVTNLGLAMAPAGSAGALTPFLNAVGPDAGLLAVWEPAQHADLDGDGTIDGYVTFALRRSPVGASFVPVSPVRLLDTRLGARPGAGGVVEVAAPVGAGAVVLNVTGVDPLVAGFVTVWPCGEVRPTASNLNLSPGLVSPNLTITKVGANGKVCIYTQSGADLVADLAGTFPA